MLRSGASERMCGSVAEPESMACRAASAVIGGALESVVARLAALVQEGPIARLGREQLPRGAHRGRPAQSPRERPQQPQLQAPAPQARSATGGESQVLQVLSLAPGRRDERDPPPRVLGDRLARGQEADTGRARPRRPPRRASSRPPTTSGRAARCRSRRPSARGVRLAPENSRRRAATAARNSSAWRRAAASAASGS